MTDANRPQGLTTIWGLIQTAALLGLLAFVYASSHTVMVSWWNNDDYSYCYLLPLIIGWIVWSKRASLAALANGGTWAALGPLAAGVLLYWLGEFGSEYYSQFLSSWFVVLALCLLFFGWPLVRQLAFAFLLFFTMLPLPQFLSNKLTVQLQLVATQMGEALIRLMGMSVYREGNIIDLGFMQLQVVEACSGLRYLFPLIVLGLVLAYFTRLRLWKKCALVAVAVPISLVLNALRIAVTALASKLLGPQVAEGFSHDFAGWAIFLLSFGLLYAVSLFLARLPGETPAQPEAKAEVATPKPPESAESAESADQESPATPDLATPGLIGRASLPLGRAPGLRFWVACAVLVATFLMITGRGGQDTPPQSRPFAEFPMQIGPWTGTAQFLDADTLNTLKLSQYVLADYQGPDKAQVNLYVAYYRSQRKGEAIHSPESCLPGTGWSVEEAGVVDIAPAAGSAPQRVNRSLASKGPSRILTWFWFAQHGRKLTSLPELKLSTFYEAITRNRTDGALVRLSTALGPHEPAARANERLRQFLRDVEPTLREFVPD
ncbi:MAG: VPLPA-CTERM-specific exosortase XrtD [Proteobacteria bacterium]|nr:VPLPA-CTERM-specific exosortase XrtD [Pseudomonadota bacterium]